MKKRLQFDIRFMLLLLTIMSVATWWWVTWPERTWRRFVASVEAGDLASANEICDPDTIRFDNVPGTPIIRVNVRSDSAASWVQVTVDPLRFSGPLPGSRSVSEVFGGVVRTGTRGSFTYGSLEVRRSRIVFVD